MQQNRPDHMSKLTSILLEVAKIPGSFAIYAAFAWACRAIPESVSKLVIIPAAIGGLTGLTAWKPPVDTVAPLRHAWHQCLTRSFHTQSTLTPNRNMAAKLALEACQLDEDALFKAAVESNPDVARGRDDLRAREKMRLVK